MDAKVCTHCHQEKPASAFYRRSAVKSGLRSWCKACTAAHKGGRPNGNADFCRSYRYRVSYGITTDQYDAMLETQGGVCAICGRACATGKRLAVDHCHATGKVRGLLCSDCNLSLGKFGDSISRLEAAISYLKKSQEPVDELQGSPGSLSGPIQPERCH